MGHPFCTPYCSRLFKSSQVKIYPPKWHASQNTQNRAPLMCLSGQPALQVRLAASSKRDGNEWAWVVNVALIAAAVRAERTCEVAGDAAKNARKVSELVFFAALKCQICAALAKVQPAQPSLRMSSAFPNAGGAVEDTQRSCMKERWLHISRGSSGMSIVQYPFTPFSWRSVLCTCRFCATASRRTKKVSLVAEAFSPRTMAAASTFSTPRLSASFKSLTYSINAPEPRQHGPHHPQLLIFRTVVTALPIPRTCTSAPAPLSRRVPQPPFHCYLTLVVPLRLLVCPAFAPAGKAE